MSTNTPACTDDSETTRFAIKLVYDQLRHRFGDLPPEIRQRLEQASIHELEIWAISLLHAKTLDQVFKDTRIIVFREYKNKKTGFRAKIRRIDDELFLTLARNGLAISVDYFFWYHLLEDSKSDGEVYLDNLSRFYAAFRQTYGESGKCYDHWKGTFNFAFEIQVVKGDSVIPYIMNILDLRGSVEFHCLKVLDPKQTEYDKSVIHQPLDDEFSRKQINDVSGYLYGFALGYWQTTIPIEGEPEFIKWVDSNLILYGYQDGQYFQKGFDDPDEYEVEKDRLKSLLSSQ